MAKSERQLSVTYELSGEFCPETEGERLEVERAIAEAGMRALMDWARLRAREKGDRGYVAHVAAGKGMTKRATVWTVEGKPQNVPAAGKKA